MCAHARDSRFTPSNPYSMVAGVLRPILITFAIPHESSDLRACLLGDQCQIMHTGIGLESAAARMKQAIDDRQPGMVISAGFAGGLDPRLGVAEPVADSTRSDARLLGDLPSGVRQGAFLSVASLLETVTAKSAAFRETGALAVDMETSAIAEACSAAGIPALFVRAISDAATAEIPIPFSASYDLARQRPRPFGVCVALLRSPSRIPRFVHFLRDLKAARAALTRTVCEVLAGCAAP